MALDIVIHLMLILNLLSLEGDTYWYHLLFIYTRLYNVTNNTMNKYLNDFRIQNETDKRRKAIYLRNCYVCP